MAAKCETAACSAVAGRLPPDGIDPVIAEQQAAAVSRFLLVSKPLEQPPVGGLIRQFVAVEHGTAETPEIFHGEHLRLGWPCKAHHSAKPMTCKVIYTQYSKKPFGDFPGEGL